MRKAFILMLMLLMLLPAWIAAADDYYTEWYGKEIQVSIEDDAWTIIFDGEEIKPSKSILLRYDQPVFADPLWGPDYIEKTLIQFEFDSGDVALYEIEWLGEDTIWMRIFDATYIPFIDDEFRLTRKAAE